MRSGEEESWQTGARIAELETLAVLPGHRGIGTGAQLVDAVYEELQRLGIGQLGVSVISANADAIRFYERLGLLPFCVSYLGNVGPVPADDRQAPPADFGINLSVVNPGEAMAMYHWEADQEGFPVLRGECLLIVEGAERPLRQWDYVHCPAGTRHVIVGAGDRPCLVLAVGARRRSAGPGWGAYTHEPAALRHNAGVEQETTDSQEAYADFERRHQRLIARAGCRTDDRPQPQAFSRPSALPTEEVRFRGTARRLRRSLRPGHP